ncbi:MAG: hypothetical protein AAGI38_03065 [Bacteroidota bacterium]
MTSFTFKTTLFCGLLLLGVAELFAQETQKLRFNGLGRTTLNNTQYGGDLQDSDTTNAARINDGEFLLDLGINATPNEKNEIQSILRLRNEFGGFFGAGFTVEVRELWGKGVIANKIRYRAGDMDISQTPFTLYLADEEGMVNEPTIFQPQKEIIEYENFFTDDNTRRMQGLKLDFALEVSQVIDEIEFEGYITRVRGTDFVSVANRFVGGGTVAFKDRKYGRIGLNYVHTFDDLSVGQVPNGIQNPVYTADWDLHLWENDNLGLHFKGEAGFSSVQLEEDSVIVFEADDNFAEGMVGFDVKQANVKVDLGFRNVGPDFITVAAQSKRVDFTRQQRYFNRIGNERFLRAPTLFDLGRDFQLYTSQISEQLMAYDLRLSNAMPYGRATPNRRGFIANIQYADSAQAVNLNVEAAILSEIAGQGTEELKDFTLIRVASDLNIHKLIDWEKDLVFTLGLQVEQTSRDGVEVEQVDLSSNLIEAGLEVELFDNFDLLLGTKILNSEGSDYVPVYDNFNTVIDFPGRTVVDDTELLTAGGFKYRFKEGIYLTAQYQTFDFSRATTPENDYALSQFFILYTMNF